MMSPLGIFDTCSLADQGGCLSAVNRHGGCTSFPLLAGAVAGRDRRVRPTWEIRMTNGELPRGVLRHGAVVLALVSPLLSGLDRASAAGDPERGAQAFRACLACHSLEPGQHRTGPSLAGVFGRKAGTAEGFRRYSPALKAADVVWNQATLDVWIADPQAFIPGNRMAFRGLPDAQARADLIAYLAQAEHQDARGHQGGMMGMGTLDMPDLKTLGPEHQVTAISHCEDTYEIATADGASEPLWEMNLRFKTDGSELGPEPGKPIIVGAGMMGDRASVVFASPKEISPFVREECRP
jgi:cytochrome c